MKCSVIIPAHNSDATIRQTLDSALDQTVVPDEILVMDDGSADQTASILESYGSRITSFWQPNGGVVSARNALCKLAKGEFIAFLDSDDLWHPKYLEMQLRLFEQFPSAVGFFAGHRNLQGYADVNWDSVTPNMDSCIEVIEPLTFVEQYNMAPGRFNMSFCCVPRRVLTEIGSEPFKAGSSGVAEDCYFHNLLPLWGPVVYTPVCLAAYRMTPGSLSSSRLRQTGGEVEAFELLAHMYDTAGDATLLRAFRTAFASKRRSHAKILLGASRIAQARAELRRSLNHNRNPISITKSVALLLLSHMPNSLQPKWPSACRGSEGHGS
jgi:hypothetical protein